MIALRANDGSSPAEFYLPESSDVGVWQTTPSCPANGGVFFQWQKMTPFGIPSDPGSQTWLEQFLPPPPPEYTSNIYAARRERTAGHDVFGPDGAEIPGKLEQGKAKARAARLEHNRAMICRQCQAKAENDRRDVPSNVRLNRYRVLGNP
ncbi:MAG: hypothetical protein M3436_11265 [Pseudomonadota bacterium]|nr:hypothetical protein [Pseudomonadota bacterium]